MLGGTKNMKEIVLIAPFEELGRKAKKIVTENNLNAEVIIGDLSQGVKEARRAVQAGARVLVSRGGTYKMIKNAVNVPVVEIKMSSFDILRGFKNLYGYSGKVGIAGYKNIIDGCEEIGELLNIQTEVIEIEKEAEARQEIEKAIKRGIRVFLGDTISTNLARQLDCKSYRIESGKEAIIDAIQEASRILAASRIEKAKSEQFKTIIHSVHDGIIAVDQNLRITVLNSLVEEMFAIKEEHVIGRKIDEFIHNTKILGSLKNNEAVIGEIVEINNGKFAVNKVPIEVENQIEGTVITLQDVTNIQDLEYKIRRNLLDKGLTAKYSFKDIIYESEAMKECIRIAERYGKFDSPILVLGQSGVGKELIAQSIHNSGKRKNGPFVAINCGAIPESLIESELFGYAEASFTGARKGGKAGLFELAHNGTIFLDEIGELPLEFQARLLRVLQEKEVMRIGGDKVIPVDVRIISATNKDIYKMVEEGEFREDLFFRINILTLMVPALKDRKEDIILLSKYFTKHYAEKYKRSIPDLTDGVVQSLLQHKYRGNVRELKTMLERAVVLCDGNKIEEKHLQVMPKREEAVDANYEKDELLSLEDFEQKYIEKILKLCKGNVSEAAKILGVNRSTLYRRLNTTDA
jgi:PAS domain S-box-containing protein